MLRYYVKGKNETSLDNCDDITSCKMNDYDFYDEENLIDPSNLFQTPGKMLSILMMNLWKLLVQKEKN